MASYKLSRSESARSSATEGGKVTLVTRFAPSPTGRLHLGHALSAMLSHDRARLADGRFLLRIDDIDGARSRAEYVEQAKEDLVWFGLTWDGEPIFQSDRLGRYEAALNHLSALELIYPCFCTRAEIEAEIAASASAPHGEFGPLYPGTCRHLSDEERLGRAHEPHCWRLDMARAMAVAAKEPLTWEDEIAGTVIAVPQEAGDVILARKDAPASYHLASTIDDADMGVTHVIRGRDLFASTHVHRLLQALLDLPTPVYHHHGLVVDSTGKRLAKRDKGTELAALRDAGFEGWALVEDLRRFVLPAGYSIA